MANALDELIATFPMSCYVVYLKNTVGVRQLVGSHVKLAVANGSSLANAAADFWRQGTVFCSKEPPGSSVVPVLKIA